MPRRTALHGTVEIGTAVEEIGKSSYRFVAGVFQGWPASPSEDPMVLIDKRKKKTPRGGASRSR